MTVMRGDRFITHDSAKGVSIDETEWRNDAY
jgi:hypothetical protein